MVKVRDVMQRDLVTVRSDATITDLVQHLNARGISGVPVVDDGVVVGVVSASDVLRFAASEREIPAGEIPALPGERLSGGDVSDDGDPDQAFVDYFLTRDSEPAWAALGLDSLSDSAYDQVRVAEIMTPAIFRVRADASIQELARFLIRAGIHRALVMERGALVGIVTAMDIVRTLADHELSAVSVKSAAPAR